MAEFGVHTRLRRSPHYHATIAEGATSFLPYNQMLIPLGYGNPEAEYRQLMEGVSMWDVAVQRQIQLKGLDAAELEIARARQIIDTFEEADTGLVVIDGKLIEKPVLRDMYRVLSIAERVGET